MINSGDKMILTIDVGNSNVVAILYDYNKKIMAQSRVDTRKVDMESYYRRWFQSFLKRIPTTIEGIIVSSVVPVVTDSLLAVLKQQSQAKVMVLSVDQLPQFKIEIDNPAELGADMIATAYAASRLYQKPIAIVDLGSANKVSVISKEGSFLGCTIAPGIGVSSASMLTMISHLPSFSYQIPEAIIGKNTVNSLQSGLLYGAVGSMVYIVDQIEAQLQQPLTRILTGGYANILSPLFKDYRFEPNLLNDGLFDIYQDITKQ